jgi:two-component system, LytTR family, sensor kinase
MKPMCSTNGKLLKYITIFLVLNGIHFLYKFYDRSYSGIWQYDLRGILFHLFFVGYGLVVWDTGILLTNRVNRIAGRHFGQNKWFVVLGLVLVAYGFAFTAIYSEIYYTLFFVGFNKESFWPDHSILDGDLVVIMFIIFLLIIGFHSFIYYFRSWQEAELTAERLQKENIRSQYEALKNQIEPHFFFNCLSVLTSLVHKDAELADRYIAQLSKMYRHLLDAKDDPVIPLTRELDFLGAYIYLITVRHTDSVQFKIELSEKTRSSVVVPKYSLQMLAENAVKHNRFSKESPLVVRISEDNEFIRIMNNHNQKDLIGGSSGIGLKNIRKRYELISEKRVELEETRFTFCVKLPKLESNEPESINF